MSGKLLPLFKKLKTCASQDDRITEKMLVETWNCLREVNLQQGNEVTPSILIAVVLYDDEQFAGILNETEHSQLFSLARIVIDRYRQITQPPNILGKAIAASLKEPS